METLSASLTICTGNSPVTSEFPSSPHKGQWRGALIFSLICAWIDGSVNTREAGDFRRHRAHYDVTVMFLIHVYSLFNGCNAKSVLCNMWHYNLSRESMVVSDACRQDILNHHVYVPRNIYDFPWQVLFRNSRLVLPACNCWLLWSLPACLSFSIDFALLDT